MVAKVNYMAVSKCDLIHILMNFSRSPIEPVVGAAAQNLRNRCAPRRRDHEADCPRRVAKNEHAPCGARYPDLSKGGLGFEIANRATVFQAER
jgi:hypothetical protein